MPFSTEAAARPPRGWLGGLRRRFGGHNQRHAPVVLDPGDRVGVVQPLEHAGNGHRRLSGRQRGTRVDHASEPLVISTRGCDSWSTVCRRLDGMRDDARDMRGGAPCRVPLSR